MTDTDIRQVRLNEGGTLYWCDNCGCVTESYRDKDTDKNPERQYRKIGEYDSISSPNKFTVRRTVLDEYQCLVKNGRLAA